MAQGHQLDGKPGHQFSHWQQIGRRPAARPGAAVPPGEHHRPRWRNVTSSTACSGATADRRPPTADHRSAPGAAARRQAGHQFSHRQQIGRRPAARPGPAVPPGEHHRPRWRKVTSSTACSGATADRRPPISARRSSSTASRATSSTRCSSATAGHRQQIDRRPARPPTNRAGVCTKKVIGAAWAATGNTFAAIFQQGPNQPAPGGAVAPQIAFNLSRNRHAPQLANPAPCPFRGLLNGYSRAVFGGLAGGMRPPYLPAASGRAGDRRGPHPAGFRPPTPRNPRTQKFG